MPSTCPKKPRKAPPPCVAPWPNRSRRSKTSRNSSGAPANAGISEPVARRLAERKSSNPVARRSPLRHRRTAPQPAARPAPDYALRGSLSATEAYAPQTPSRTEGGGWISDLLRGASREEPTTEAATARTAIGTSPGPGTPPAPDAAAATRQGDNRNPRHIGIAELAVGRHRPCH